MNEVISWDALAFLFSIAILAGFIDTLVGGGGLIALPSLLIAGVPPLAALGTNKLQGSFGTATASYLMLRKGRIVWSDVRWLMLLAFLGSGVGSAVVQLINIDVLKIAIPIVLVAIALYFLFSRSGESRREASPRGTMAFRCIATPAIGFYDGMFGPGTGSFFGLAGVSLKGLDLVTATALAKALNFATNVASLIIFLLAGKVVWLAGLVMIGGQLIGATIGSHVLLRVPAKVLRFMVVLVCVTMIVRYGLSENWW